MNFIRYVGSNACNSTRHRDCLSSEDYVVVDRLSARANASVDFDIDGRPLGLKTSGTVQDFLDVAILVYLADEMVSRAESQDYWTRSMNCLVPVVDPDAWARSQAALKRSLSLLSGDDWTFEWIPRVAGVPFLNHRKRLPYGFDAVCLFSGGADSLLGAIRLLEQGKRLILVGHQAEGQSARAQTDLAAELRRLYPGKFHFVQSRISRSRRTATDFPLAVKQEISHRPRSFLFLALAVAVAKECGINDIFMPENGFMTLNIPIQKSRTGSLSTRTTHPAFVLQFLDLCRSLGLNVTVRNPFLTQSKTDMLRGLSPSLVSVIKRSVSCSRPGRFNDRHVRHCGYCVPCILRRVAFMEAGLDSASDYAFDVFGNLGALVSGKQQDMRALAGFAMELANADSAQLELRVLSHGYFPPDVGLMIGMGSTSDYAPWTNMLRTWASDFLVKLADTPTRTRQVIGLPGGGAA